jgi:hypothetical protein
MLNKTIAIGDIGHYWSEGYWDFPSPSAVLAA